MVFILLTTFSLITQFCFNNTYLPSISFSLLLARSDATAVQYLSASTYNRQECLKYSTAPSSPQSQEEMSELRFQKLESPFFVIYTHIYISCLPLPSKLSYH